MKLALAILIAYAATGVFCVWRDLRDPVGAVGAVINYRTGGGPLWLLFAGVTWLPATAIAIYWKPGLTHMKREIAALAVFLVIAIIIDKISN